MMAADCDTGYLELVRKTCNQVIDEIVSGNQDGDDVDMTGQFLTAGGCEATARRLVVELRSVRSFYHKQIPPLCVATGGGFNCVEKFLNVS